MRKYSCAMEKLWFTYMHCTTGFIFSITCKSLTISNLSVLLASRRVVWICLVVDLSEAVTLKHEQQLVCAVVRELAVSRQLVKTKIHSNKQAHFRPQNNMQIKFLPSTQHYISFLKLYSTLLENMVAVEMSY